MRKAKQYSIETVINKLGIINKAGFDITDQMKYIKIISWFLGVQFIMFGILKFFNPIKEWYSIQVSASELPPGSYFIGQFGDIVVGSILIVALLLHNEWSPKRFSIVLILSSSAIVGMMLTAIYVHLHPDVPAEVLPLGIKPPFIPGFTLLTALINIFLARRQLNMI